METRECILGRKSIRKFNNKPISVTDLKEILEAARWAPSGKNKQPWRFYVIQNEQLIEEISNATVYKAWIKQANAFIVVYLDKASSYDDRKDMHGIGAAIQNMLLMAYDKGISSCWNGEILASAHKVNHILKVNDDLELMAVIALGYTDIKEQEPVKRVCLDDLVIDWLI